MLKSIRILLVIATYYDYEIWQMDVKTAFLNGNLSEDVYMTQPEDFINQQKVRKVYRLMKAIYGLKQASRSRNQIKFSKHTKLKFGEINREQVVCRTGGQ
jgi:hypothetical protein